MAAGQGYQGGLRVLVPQESSQLVPLVPAVGITSGQCPLYGVGLGSHVQVAGAQRPVGRTRGCNWLLSGCRPTWGGVPAGRQGWAPGRRQSCMGGGHGWCPGPIPQECGGWGWSHGAVVPWGAVPWCETGGWCWGVQCLGSAPRCGAGSCGQGWGGGNLCARIPNPGAAAAPPPPAGLFIFSARSPAGPL